MEKYPSAQPPLQKRIFDTSCRKLRKSRYQSFLALFNFALFIYFISNTFPKIVDTYSRKKIFKQSAFLFFFTCWFFEVSTFPNTPLPLISFQ